MCKLVQESDTIGVTLYVRACWLSPIRVGDPDCFRLKISHNLLAVLSVKHKTLSVISEDENSIEKCVTCYQGNE